MSIALPQLPVAVLCSMSEDLQSEIFCRGMRMLFAPETDPKTWGAGLPASPILGIENPDERSTVFLIPLSRWSDGTPSVSEDN